MFIPNINILPIMNQIVLSSEIEMGRNILFLDWETDGEFGGRVDFSIDDIC